MLVKFSTVGELSITLPWLLKSSIIKNSLVHRTTDYKWSANSLRKMLLVMGSTLEYVSL